MTRRMFLAALTAPLVAQDPHEDGPPPTPAVVSLAGELAADGYGTGAFYVDEHLALTFRDHAGAEATALLALTGRRVRVTIAPDAAPLLEPV